MTRRRDESAASTDGHIDSLVAQANELVGAASRFRLEDEQQAGGLPAPAFALRPAG